ncbi:MAG TPA: glycosyltransferase family 4 protein [Acidimicrobiales bacterium]|nr:glycosyltransferase family 4 protein [Acidimicrobiales bacterium]
MRVLVVHNRYSAATPSGENVSVDHEVAWLREAGLDVAVHEVSNDDVLGAGAGVKLRAAAETPWSPRAAARFDEAARAARPDLVHVHNLFPLLTASVPARALRAGLPVVWTARNLRVVCVEGTHFRDGHDCAECRPGWRLPGVRYGCYRGSVPASALVTGATALFRRVARRRVTTVAISETMRDWLVGEAGFAPERVRVKYNGVPAPSPESTDAGPAARRTFLFVGKFAAYKGVDLLLDAWRRVAHPDAALCFVGDGPLAGRVREATADPRITWVGAVPPSEVAEHMARARAVVVPSVWDEPFGRVAAEALALGRPVVTTGRGGLAEVVGDEAGWITGTGPAALARAIDEAAGSDEAVTRRGAAGRRRHAEAFSPEATTRALLAVYEEALTGHRRGGHSAR